jgi:formate hydrogenlyase subunit 3/multisubunit Na+/H+ antiporter MnhD subunit
MPMLRYAIETVGWIGAALMLSAYLFLMLGRISSRSPMYQWMNVFAGAGFVINSGSNGAYPSAFINVVWMAISFYGLWSRGHGAPIKPSTMPE